jgi:hypothetical protein
MTPAEHAARVRTGIQTYSSDMDRAAAYEALLALVVLAERTTELERERDEALDKVQEYHDFAEEHLKQRERAEAKLDVRRWTYDQGYADGSAEAGYGEFFKSLIAERDEWHKRAARAERAEKDVRDMSAGAWGSSAAMIVGLKHRAEQAEAALREIADDADRTEAGLEQHSGHGQMAAMSALGERAGKIARAALARPEARE